MAVIVPNMEEASTQKHKKKSQKSVFLLAQDLNYSRKLAENDEKSRRKALKYLKKYLEHRSKASQISEENLQVLWKGLFYSMWMSDKPLVQEDCAESIAHLIHSFNFDEAMQFFKVGVLTLQNEWIGIDQLRMDKFLMFVRRLLRQAFVVLRGRNFKKVANRAFTDILEATVLSSNSYVPLGLFMHFTEIYLEELAKISEGKLQPTRTLDLLLPFINRLAFAKDNRIINWINKFIFTHLMKQHKLGLEYEEKYKVWRQQGFQGSINQVQKVRVSEDDSESGLSDEDLPASVQEKNKPLDPRAGKVDVELPQILFNAKELSEALEALKIDKRTTKSTRIHLNIWAEKFMKLHNGVYPLGLKRLTPKKPKKDVDLNVTKAAKRLIKFEQKLLGKNQKKRKREESLSEELEDLPKQKRKKKSAEIAISSLNKKAKKTKKMKAVVDDNVLESTSEPKKKKKRKEKKNMPNMEVSFDEYNWCFERNSGMWFVTREDNDKVGLMAQPLGKTNNGDFEVTVNNDALELAAKLKEKRLKKKEKRLNKKEKPLNKSDSSKLRGKARLSLSHTLTPNNKVLHIVKELQGLKSVTPKRVVINTKLNVSQEIDDHIRKVRKSPQLPWDSRKKPGKPLLKTPTKPNYINPFYKLKF